jgi:hypothetical protein
MKIASIIGESVKKRVNNTKDIAKVGLSWIKLNSGDHMCMRDHMGMPSTNITEIANDMIPVIVRKELIITAGFCVVGRKRTSVASKPSKLSIPIKLMADIIALAEPTSVLVYNLATMIQKKRPRTVIMTVLVMRKREFRYKGSLMCRYNLRVHLVNMESLFSVGVEPSLII